MNSWTPTREYLSQAIDELPSEALPELANFIEYLRFKLNYPQPSMKAEPETNNFLMSIAGLGESEETDLSERDEEILASEIDSIRGFHCQPSEP